MPDWEQENRRDLRRTVVGMKKVEEDLSTSVKSKMKFYVYRVAKSWRNSATYSAIG